MSSTADVCARWSGRSGAEPHQLPHVQQGNPPVAGQVACCPTDYCATGALAGGLVAVCKENREIALVYIPITVEVPRDCGLKPIFQEEASRGKLSDKRGVKIL